MSIVFKKCDNHHSVISAGVYPRELMYPHEKITSGQLLPSVKKGMSINFCGNVGWISEHSERNPPFFWWITPCLRQV